MRDFSEKERLIARFGEINNDIEELYGEAIAALSREDKGWTTERTTAVQSFAEAVLEIEGICAHSEEGSEDQDIEDQDVSVDQQISASFCELLESLREYEKEAEDPALLAFRVLSSSRPKFLMFTEQDRDLRTTYDLAKAVSAPPTALANLAFLSGLDLQLLVDSINHGNSGRREMLLERANLRLRDVFEASWKQSTMTVRLALRGTTLEVLTSIPEGGYNEIQERSTGLRTFVALRGFLSQKGSESPPILLVDEAEQHLHYDAQASLIDLFTEQRLAAKVIYSTHSAGCLPRDLGNSIRVVIPDPESERSSVENSVWTGRKAGFSPLIYGMGATTFAFLPARFVVLGEGPSDAMLYPTLFREALGGQHLTFQVAPGLASTSPLGMLDLTSEGGRVVFLTDGDRDGQRYRKTLASQGVDAAQLVGLDDEFAELTILEDMIDPKLYTDVVNELLKDFQNATVEVGLQSLPVTERTNAVQLWCQDHGLKPPEKTKIAQRLLDRKSSAAREGMYIQLLAASHQEAMVRLYDRINRVFGPRIGASPRANAR